MLMGTCSSCFMWDVGLQTGILLIVLTWTMAQENSRSGSHLRSSQASGSRMRSRAQGGGLTCSQGPRLNLKRRSAPESSIGLRVLEILHENPDSVAKHVHGQSSLKPAASSSEAYVLQCAASQLYLSRICIDKRSMVQAQGGPQVGLVRSSCGKPCEPTSLRMARKGAMTLRSPGVLITACSSLLVYVRGCGKLVGPGTCRISSPVLGAACAPRSCLCWYMLWHMGVCLHQLRMSVLSSCVTAC